MTPFEPDDDREISPDEARRMIRRMIAGVAVPDDALPGETPGQYLRRKLSFADAMRTAKAPTEPQPIRPSGLRRKVNPFFDQADAEKLAEVLAELEAKRAEASARSVDARVVAQGGET
jgi:hypothetical protein